MILVDGRAGSQDLVEPLRNAGLPVEETTLEYGDLAFLGRGEKGATVWCGVEHKKLPDLVQSLSNGRLAGHQLPGMLDAYDRCWLIVEGDWSHDSTGHVSVWRGKGTRRPMRGAPPALELEKRLLTLEIRGGIRVRHCPTRRDTLRFLHGLYRWWTDDDMEEHRSHLAIHAPDLDSSIIIPVTDFRRTVAQMPGIGLKTSRAVESHFDGSFRRMMLASPAEWAEITTSDTSGKTRRLGAARAKTITEFLTK